MAPQVARPRSCIRIASNPWLENATLNLLMERLGYLKLFGAKAEIVEAEGVSGPFDAICAGKADLCMVSGYNKVLARIEQGASVKIVGAGMRKAAMTVFAQPGSIGTLDDLQGKVVAVGPNFGLLHALMLMLLNAKGVDANRVNFVDMGSNDQCYRAVAMGKADACCASISHLRDSNRLTVVSGGNMWEALPNITFQTAFASDAVIRDKNEELVAVMAAYGALYNHLMTPEAQDAFLAARKTAQHDFDEPAARATWDFIQTQRPYCGNLSLTTTDVSYLQNELVSIGGLKRSMPYVAVADMSAARMAARLLG